MLSLSEERSFKATGFGVGEDIVASGFAEAGLDEAAEEVTEVVSDEDALIFGTWMIEGDEGGVLMVDEVAYGPELTRRRRALHYRIMRYVSCARRMGTHSSTR